MVSMAPILFSLLASLSALVILASGKNTSAFPSPQRLPEALKLLGIYKRQASKVGFNAAEKAEMLKLHNDYRRDEGATNMLEMSWDADLETFAQKHTEKCVFAHTTNSERTNIGKHAKSGENLYVTTGGLNVKDVASSWFDEKKGYNFDTKACSIPMCGHYTQLVWHASWALGCGVYMCSVVTGISQPMNNAYLVNCQYAPPGNSFLNSVAQPVYNKGSPCSECPSNRTCSNKLCALPSSSRGVVQAHLMVSTMIMAFLLVLF